MKTIGWNQLNKFRASGSPLRLRKPLGQRCAFILLCILLSFPNWLAAQNPEGDLFRPPIITVKLSNVESRPSGVATDTTFAGGAGGFLDFPFDEVDQPTWVGVPNHFSYPTSFPVFTYRACGLPSRDVRGALIAPNGNTVSTTSNYNGNGCWSFNSLPRSGLELGQYTFRVNSAVGDLSYTHTIGFPSCPLQTFITDGNTVLSDIILMGFPSDSALTIHFYERNDLFEVNYVATRTVQTDNSGTVILKIEISRSSPFWSHAIDIGIQGYLKDQVNAFEARYLVSENAPCIDERLPYSRAPYDIDEIQRYESIWSNLEFIDMSSPGTQVYDVAIPSGQTFNLGFSWCGDTAARKQEILEPLSVAFFINQSEIIPASILIADDRTCRRWVTLLSGWELGTSMALEVRYSLSKRIFDGTSYYEAGDYIQRIVVHVQQ